MKTDTMYKIVVKNSEEAGRVIHHFLTLDLLTNPELTVFKSANEGIDSHEAMKTYGCHELPSLIQIQQFVLSDKPEGIMCVAATDKADIRRVVLSYLPGMEFIVLSFPMAHNGLNEVECELLDFLSK